MLSANGLYGHIRNNALKSALLMVGFVGLIWLYWCGACLIVTAIKLGFFSHSHFDTVLEALQEMSSTALDTAVERWYIPLFISATWFTIAWFFYKRMIRAATGAEPVERRQEPKLYNLVENLAISAGLPLPRIEIMECDELNAYASGLSPSSATVAVTRGLLDTLDKDELEAVLAHEMTHIKNRDVQLMVVALIFAGGITFLGDLLRFLLSGARGAHDDEPRTTWYFFPRVNLFSSDSEGSADEDTGKFAFVAIIAAIIAIVVGFVMMGMAHVFAVMTQFAVSRSREFMADAGAVELTKDPDALISALRRISGRDDVPVACEGLKAMMISRPMADDEGALDQMFATHPSVDDRVSSLEKFAGGKVRAKRRAPTTVKAPPAPVYVSGTRGRRLPGMDALTPSAPSGTVAARGFDRRPVGAR